MTTPATPEPTSGDLRALWDAYTEADNRATGKSHLRDATKADYDTLQKANGDIATVTEDYRKAYQQLTDQYQTLYRFVVEQVVPPDPATAPKPPPPQSRYREKVSDAREGKIRTAAEHLVQKETEIREAIQDPRSLYGSCPPDLEEKAQAAAEVYEGKKKAAELAGRRFEEVKTQPKAIEARHKAWAELKDRAEKAFAEAKYERAFFYLVLLHARMKDKAPPPVIELRNQMVRAWKGWARKKAEVRDALKEYDHGALPLEEKRKQLEQLLKTGEADVIRDLNLDGV